MIAKIANRARIHNLYIVDGLERACIDEDVVVHEAVADSQWLATGFVSPERPPFMSVQEVVVT
jgi:hypothetical protein